MSHADGWAALNLEMPPRVPRTEYSAHRHYELIRAVTGIDVKVEDPLEKRLAAGREFIKVWT